MPLPIVAFHRETHRFQVADLKSAAARTRHGSQGMTLTTLKPTSAMRPAGRGLYVGDCVRAERDGSKWHAEVRMRDVGAPMGTDTSIFEFDHSGEWISIGTYQRLSTIEAAYRTLSGGTGFYRREHNSDLGHVPGRIIDPQELQAALVDLGLAEAPPSP